MEQNITEEQNIYTTSYSVIQKGFRKAFLIFLGSLLLGLLTGLLK